MGYVALTVLALVVLAGTVVPGSPLLAVVSVGVAGAAALGAFALAAVVRVRSWSAFGVRATTWRWLLLGAAGGVVGWLVNRVIVVGYVLASGDTSNPQEGFLPGITGAFGTFALMMLLGAVLVPIGEELLFRGVVTTALGPLRRLGRGARQRPGLRARPRLSIVLPAAFVLGVINALLLRRSGSVWPGVVAHGVNNALVFGLTAILL